MTALSPATVMAKAGKTAGREVSQRVANGPGSDVSPSGVFGVFAGADRVIRPIAYGAAVALVAILFSVAGAFDTDEISLAHRLALWTVVPGLVVAQAILLRSSVKSLPIAAQYAAVVPAIVVIAALEIHALKFTPLVPHAPDPILGFILFVAPTVAPIAMAVVTAEVLFDAHSGPAVAASAAGPELRIAEDGLAALPLNEVEWARSHDHYLEVSLAGGRRRFVRGRMGDAAALLAHLDGAQVHRSWWVARAAVERVETRGRDRVIRLKDGVDAPIGRSRVDKLRAAGWI